MQDIEFITYGSRERYDEHFDEIAEFFISNTPDTFNQNWHIGRFDWMMGHPYLDKDMLSKIGIWKQDGKVVALVLGDTEYPPIYLLCDEQHGFLREAMLDYAEQAFRTQKHSDKGDWLKIVANDEDAEFIDLLKRRGYAIDDWTETVLELECDKNHPLRYELADGFTLTDYEETNDIDKVRWAIFKGFENEGDAPEDLGKPASVTCPFHYYDNSLKVYTVAPDGEFASHCGIWYNEINRIAYIEPVFTLPEYRGKGLAKAAIYEAINRCAERGAVKAVVLSDMEFYFNLGMKKTAGYHHWAKYFD